MEPLNDLGFLDPINQLKWQELIRVSQAIIPNNGGVSLAAQDFKSTNFISGVSGWKIGSNGDVEFQDGTFRGEIDATSGTIGGFTISATKLTGPGNTTPSTIETHSSAEQGIKINSGNYATNVADGFIEFWTTGGDATYIYARNSDGKIYIEGAGGLYIDGPLTSEGIFNVTMPTASNCQLGGQKLGIQRWVIRPGDSTSESGSNAGSNFKIDAYADNGANLIATPIMIERKTGNIVISEFGSTLPHASSILEVQSTTKGVRFPNMTTTQRDNITPGAGTVIYNTTTGKLNVYTTAWEAITSA